MNRKPEMLRRVIGSAEDLPRLRRLRRHSFTATWTGANQDQLANELRGLQGDLLGDEAADRDAEHIDLGQAKRFDESDCVGPHLLQCGRHLARARRDAGIVEQDHLAVAGEAIGHRRVPVIHGAEEVLVEDDRHAAGLAKAAIGEADAIGLDELRRRGLVGICGHVATSFAGGLGQGRGARPSDTREGQWPRPWAMPSFSSSAWGSK
jgi:hypothetical protein